MFPLPLRTKTKPLTFSALFITGNRKIARENVAYSDLKCPKMPLSALKFHFLQITFFSAVITRTHHLPTHTPFFRPIMSKKWALHLFLKITFFLLCTPSPYPRTFPNQLFRQTNDQKWSKNLPKEEIFFFFFL